MTTVKEILTKKESGDDTDFKYQLAMACNAAEALDKAEQEVARRKNVFEKASSLVTELTGFELWHNDIEGGKYYWHNKNNHDDSAYYPTRATALHALATDTVEWI